MGKHAIIVIKNKDKKYLQYYDNNWNSYLFPNCRIENEFDEEVIKKTLENELEIIDNEIECTYIGKKKHMKFSEKDKKQKIYEHYFFDINIYKMPNNMISEKFEICGIEYKWFSYDELKNDCRIQKVNSDIVNYVKEFNL